jgi:hypothetical protein
MPRSSLARDSSICWLALAFLAGAWQAQLLRAEPPLNPLRTAASQSTLLRIAPSGNPPLDLRQVGQDEPPAAPPSVVPENLGQPELLPQPRSSQLLDSQFVDPDLGQVEPWPQLVHPLFAEPWFAHGDPNDPLRHIGIGQPLVGTSWRNRPLYFGTFVGGIMMDDLVSDEIYQNDTTFVGARLGYDFDHFWGLESRWAFARPDLANGSGTPHFPASRDNFADVSLVFYPLGDARWRPYFSAGLGFQTFRFNDLAGQRISEATLELPLGAGIKYFYGPFFTLRFDFVDNLSFGNARISGMNNIALMMGCEVRFGGRRPSYFPWHNNTTYW